MVEWTLKQAARECQVSFDTVKRRLPELQEHGAAKDENGAWRVTPQQLMAVGLRPGAPSPPEGEAPRADSETAQGTAPAQPDTALVQRITELEQQLTVERVRREAAEQLAVERERALDRVDQAMRMLEARPVPTPAQLVEEASPQPPAAAPRRWWQRGA